MIVITEETIDEIISKLTDIKWTLKNLACGQCENKGNDDVCDYCYNCDHFELKGADDE